MAIMFSHDSCIKATCNVNNPIFHSFLGISEGEICGALLEMAHSDMVNNVSLNRRNSHKTNWGQFTNGVQFSQGK